MNRRGLLTIAAKLGAGSALASSFPALFLAESERNRRLHWYETHCVDCGEYLGDPEQRHRSTGYRGPFLCWLCGNVSGSFEFATYRDNPPPDFGPGPGWGLASPRKQT